MCIATKQTVDENHVIQHNVELQSKLTGSNAQLCNTQTDQSSFWAVPVYADVQARLLQRNRATLYII